MRSPISCGGENMDTHLFGNLSIKNVDTKDWSKQRGDTLEMRLAMQESGGVYDLLQFMYTWDETLP